MKTPFSTLWGGVGATLVLLSALPVSAQTTTPVVIQDSITLARVRVATGGSSFLANDFHMRFKADRQWFLNPTTPSWAPMILSDLNPGGYYFECGASVTPLSFSATQVGEWIDLYWTFPDTWINSTQYNKFGFTNFGGVRFRDVQWNWTYNGVDVSTLPENWQDWYKDILTGEMVDEIRNGEVTPLTLDRLTGSRATPVVITDLASMLTPPNPFEPDPGPVVIGGGATIDYRWDWPGDDPSYYMFYETNSGNNNIWFTNASNVAPIPEASMMLLLGLAPAMLVRRRRS